MGDTAIHADSGLPRILIEDGVQRPALRVEQEFPLAFTYRNWRGESRERRVLPRFVWFGATEWHPEPQWLLNAFDLDREGHPEREFAMRDMTNVRRP